MKKLSSRSISLVAVLCISLLFSCTADVDPPSPPPISSSSANEIGELSSSSLPSGFVASSSSIEQPSSGSSLPIGNVLCSLGEQCLYIPANDCSVIGGQEVLICRPPVASSSSGEVSPPPTSSSSNAINPLPSSSSGGVSPPPASSSSSTGQPFSSSSLPIGNVLCLFNGSCVSIDLGTCSAIGGQQIQSCPASSSSSIALPSSNSAVPSSSSAAPIVQSSSSVPLSSSSSKPSSSSTPLPSSSSVVASSSSSSTRCKDEQGSDYFCKWKTGCWAIDPTYSTPTGQTCSDLVLNCRSYGFLYVNSTVEGEDLSCTGTLVPYTPPPGVVYGTPVTYGGETYKTVVIGTQTWMSRNLNFNAEGSVCYDNNDDYCATYGRLYNWVTAMNLPSNCNSSICTSQVNAKHRGICPSGWHIPSDADWTTLTDFVGDNAGTKLKATSSWTGSGNGTDVYGFSAFPGGDGTSNSRFNNLSNEGNWWSTTERDDVGTNILSVGYYSSIFRYYSYKSAFLSLRCLKD